MPRARRGRIVKLQTRQRALTYGRALDPMFDPVLQSPRPLQLQYYIPLDDEQAQDKERKGANVVEKTRIYKRRNWQGILDGATDDPPRALEEHDAALLRSDDGSPSRTEQVPLLNLDFEHRHGREIAGFGPALAEPELPNLDATREQRSAFGNHFPKFASKVWTAYTSIAKPSRQNASQAKSGSRTTSTGLSTSKVKLKLTASRMLNPSQQNDFSCTAHRVQEANEIGRDSLVCREHTSTPSRSSNSCPWRITVTKTWNIEKTPAFWAAEEPDLSQYPLNEDEFQESRWRHRWSSKFLASTESNVSWVSTPIRGAILEESIMVDTPESRTCASSVMRSEIHPAPEEYLNDNEVDYHNIIQGTATKIRSGGSSARRGTANGSVASSPSGLRRATWLGTFGSNDRVAEDRNTDADLETTFSVQPDFHLEPKDTISGVRRLRSKRVQRGSWERSSSSLSVGEMKLDDFVSASPKLRGGAYSPAGSDIDYDDETTSTDLASNDEYSLDDASHASCSPVDCQLNAEEGRRSYCETDVRLSADTATALEPSKNVYAKEDLDQTAIHSLPEVKDSPQEDDEESTTAPSPLLGFACRRQESEEYVGRQAAKSDCSSETEEISDNGSSESLPTFATPSASRPDGVLPAQHIEHAHIDVRRRSRALSPAYKERSRKMKISWNEMQEVERKEKIKRMQAAAAAQGQDNRPAHRSRAQSLNTRGRPSFGFHKNVSVGPSQEASTTSGYRGINAQRVSCPISASMSAHCGRASTRAYPPTCDEANQSRSPLRTESSDANLVENPTGTIEPEAEPPRPLALWSSLDSRVPGRKVIDLPRPPSTWAVDPPQFSRLLDSAESSTALQGESTEDEDTPKAEDCNKQFDFPEAASTIIGKENMPLGSDAEDTILGGDGANDGSPSTGKTDGEAKGSCSVGSEHSIGYSGIPLTPSLLTSPFITSTGVALLDDLGNQVSAMQVTLASLPGLIQDLQLAVERIEKHAQITNSDVYDLLENNDTVAAAATPTDEMSRRNERAAMPIFERQSVREVVHYIVDCIEGLSDEFVQLRNKFDQASGFRAMRIKDGPQGLDELLGLRQDIDSLRQGQNRIEKLLVAKKEAQPRKSSLSTRSSSLSPPDELDKLHRENQVLRSLLASSTPSTSHTGSSCGSPGEVSPRSRQVSWSEEVQVKVIECKDHEYVEDSPMHKNQESPEGVVVQGMNGPETIQGLNDGRKDADFNNEDANPFDSNASWMAERESHNFSERHQPARLKPSSRYCISDLTSQVQDDSSDDGPSELGSGMQLCCHALQVTDDEQIAREPMTRAEIEYRARVLEEERLMQREEERNGWPAWLWRMMRSLFTL